MAQANADIDGLKARFSQMQQKQANPQATSPQDQATQTTPQETTSPPTNPQPNTASQTQATQTTPQETSTENAPTAPEGTKSPLDALQGVQNTSAEEEKPTVNVVEVEGENNAVVGETVVKADVVEGGQAKKESNNTIPETAAIQTQGQEVTDETIIEESLEDLREEYDDAKLNSVIIEQVKELIEIDNNLNNKLEDIRIDLKKEVEERQKLDKKIDDNYAELKELEKSIDKFIALYELVTNQFNPFVKQDEAETQQKMQNLMKDVKKSEQNLQTTHEQQAAPQNTMPPSQHNPQQQTDFHFETKNGLRVNTLAQLVDAIQNMSDGEFLHHVSDSKNDFATWIGSALRNPTLAQKIQALKTKQEILQVIQENVQTQNPAPQ